MATIENKTLFEDSWKRVDRSIVHANAFITEFRRLFPNDGYTVRLDQESPGTFVAIALFKTPASMENSLALELGEFFTSSEVPSMRPFGRQ